MLHVFIRTFIDVVDFCTTLLNLLISTLSFSSIKCVRPHELGLLVPGGIDAIHHYG